MDDTLLAADWRAEARPILAVPVAEADARLAALPPLAAAYARGMGFSAKFGEVLVLPGSEGEPGAALLGLGRPEDLAAEPLVAGALATALPPGIWRLEHDFGDPTLSAVAFALGAYRFRRYRSATREPPRLAVGRAADLTEARRIAAAVAFGRDLVNTPANDLGPAELAAAARIVADRHGAAWREVSGDSLKAGFPLVYAVGAGSPRAPRLVELAWGEPQARKLTLVGKGVVFDTGGLDIKPEQAMLLMKKDMGGAAAALALADLVMGAGLSLRLRVLLPIVENAVSGDAFRPGDVFLSRKGLSVEIGNTDAEGRLILADALAAGAEDEPDLIVDFATLTGAARVALGPDLPPIYTPDDRLAEALAARGSAIGDPLWRLPLWAPYHAMLESKIADLNNVSASPFAGSITAALFLSRFVEGARHWVHVDLFGWNPKVKPGRPEGGEVQAARAFYEVLKDWARHDRAPWSEAARP